MGISGGRNKMGNCLRFTARITGWFCQSICKLIQAYFSKLFQGLVVETMWHYVTVLKKRKHVKIYREMKRTTGKEKRTENNHIVSSSTIVNFSNRKSSIKIMK